MQSRGSHWVVGIDAGATSTKGILVNLKGEELASQQGSAFNLRFQKVSEFEETVFNLVHELISTAHLGGHAPGAIGIGVAGAGRERDQTMLRDAIAHRFPQSHVVLNHDAWIAHYGAFSGRSGILVTAGTGSIAFGRNEAGEEARAGGWGWMLGDEGSGWWIGREAIRAALAEWEGSGPATKITDLILEAFELSDIYDVIPEIYHEKIARRDIISLAKPVGELAKAGDEIAIDIYHRAGLALGRMAVTTARSLDIGPEELRVSMLGSIAVGDWDLVAEGVHQILDEYASTEGEPDSTPVEQAEEETEEKYPVPPMPEFPPKDLTINEEKGPLLIQPEMSAVRGAAQWAIDIFNERLFA